MWCSTPPGSANLSICPCRPSCARRGDVGGDDRFIAEIVTLLYAAAIAACRSSTTQACSPVLSATATCCAASLDARLGFAGRADGSQQVRRQFQKLQNQHQVALPTS